MMKKLRAWPDAKADPYGYQRQLKIELPNPSPFLRQNVLIIRIGSDLNAPLDLVDCYLPALCMLAMAEGLDVRIHGAASRQALANMVEFQLAWLIWHPQRFKRLAEIEVDQIVDDFPRRTARAVQAFSGGLDAIFTTWFHKMGGLPIARLPLDLAVFVHGFDIPRNDKQAFDLAFAKGRKVLDSVGVDLIGVKTNLRGAINVGWEAFHGAAIAAVLGQFSNEYTHGLIGSSGSYRSLIIPWGSNPLTDHLMSGAKMSFVHVGSGYERSDKVRAISDWQIAADNLRVCWRNTDNSANCGKCEKCIATALAFRAWGKPIPPSLKTEITEQDIMQCIISSKNQRKRLLRLRDLAIKNQVDEPWVNAITRKFSLPNG